MFLQQSKPESEKHAKRKKREHERIVFHRKEEEECER